MKQKTAVQRRKTKIRQKIKKSGRGRKLTVYRTNKHMWVQIIDLPSGKSLISANTKVINFENKTKTEQAYELGKIVAEKALDQGIKQAAFDRGSYHYHGRVKALAEGARKGGLKI